MKDQPAAFKLARRLVRFDRAYRSGCLNTAQGAGRKFSDAQFETEQAFFAALEAESGIDRDMFRQLGGVL